MVEELVGDYLTTKTSLVKGVDLFLGGLPGGTSEGAVVQTHTDTGQRNILNYCLITIALLYADYTTGRELAGNIQEALMEQLGAEDGTFASLDPVTIHYYGTDNLGRNLFAVTLQVCYRAATI